MDCNNYKMMIQEFHDGMLSKGAEPLLFTHLSQCSDCCEQLKALNTISSFHKEEMKILGTNIDTVVFRTISKRRLKPNNSLMTRKVPAIVVYALVVLLIFVVYLYNNYTNNYRAELQNAVEEIRDLNYNTKLLLEAPEEYVVKAKYAKNEIVIRPKKKRIV